VAAYLLHQGITITCPHGGTATVTPTNQRVKVGGQPVLVATDVTMVGGCSFTIGTAPSPCLQVRWQQPAKKVKVAGKPALLSSSLALCVNAAGAPQGKATVSGYQTRAAGR
jgi:uncharacterized protein DUF4280